LEAGIGRSKLVRFKSKADICTAPAHVRFNPKSGHSAKHKVQTANRKSYQGHGALPAVRLARIDPSQRRASAIQ